MSPEQGKLLLKVFTDAMKMETEHTKKVLRAIPEDKKSYKPDPKARSAHELAWHIVSAEVWFMDFVIAGRPDFPWSEPAAPPTIDAILAWYDQNYSDRLGKLKSLPADKLVVTVAFPGAPELPIIDFLNILNLHSAHHRGQLSTYLRPMGSKVPSMYGGSADEPYQSA